MKRQFLLHKSSTTEATVVQKAFWTNAYGLALAPWDGRFNLSKELKHLAESVLRKLESFLPFFSRGPLVGGPVDQVPGSISDAEPWRLLHTALHRHNHLQQASTYGPPTRSYAGQFTPIMSPPTLQFTMNLQILIVLIETIPKKTCKQPSTYLSSSVPGIQYIKELSRSQTLRCYWFSTHPAQEGS